jgi:hypothetical protein
MCYGLVLSLFFKIKKMEYIIKLTKKETEIINEHTFNPKIHFSFVENIAVHAFLNFPYNYQTWSIPKKFKKYKVCKIKEFDNTKIVLSFLALAITRNY